MAHAASRVNLGLLLRDRSGVVALYFALVVGSCVLLALAGLDLIRVHLARSHMAMAVDSAILAAGRSLGAAANWRNVGVAYYNANMTPLLGVTFPTIAAADFVESTVGTGQSTRRVTLTVTGSVPLLTAGLIDAAAMSVRVSSVAERRSQTVDLAMVLDNTGSMAGTNIERLRTASNTLVTALANGQATTLPFARVAVVPYAVAVNLGIPAGGGSYTPPGGASTVPATVSEVPADYRANTVAQLLVPGTTFDPANALGWHGCVLETAGLAIQPPAGHVWQPYIWGNAKDNNYNPANANSVRSSLVSGNEGSGPNLGCPETPITPLTNNIANLTKVLNAMQPWHRGGTLSDVGLAWGARALSPDPPFANGAAWGNGRVTRAVVLMTDGDANFNVYTRADAPNNWASTSTNYTNPDVNSDYGAYGRLDQLGLVGTTDRATARANVEANLGALCTRLKAAPFNMRIFTVTFGGLNPTTTAVYSACASTPNDYIPAADGTALTNAFTTIGGALSELVLVQ